MGGVDGVGALTSDGVAIPEGIWPGDGLQLMEIDQYSHPNVTVGR
jgi:hypothetical protein